MLPVVVVADTDVVGSGHRGEEVAAIVVATEGEDEDIIRIESCEVKLTQALSGEELGAAEGDLLS